MSCVWTLKQDFHSFASGSVRICEGVQVLWDKNWSLHGSVLLMTVLTFWCLAGIIFHNQKHIWLIFEKKSTLSSHLIACTFIARTFIVSQAKDLCKHKLQNFSPNQLQHFLGICVFNLKMSSIIWTCEASLALQLCVLILTSWLQCVFLTRNCVGICASSFLSAACLFGGALEWCHHWSYIELLPEVTLCNWIMVIWMVLNKVSPVIFSWQKIFKKKKMMSFQPFCAAFGPLFLNECRILTAIVC